MQRIYVKPARLGLIVRDPHTKRPLPDDGGRVPDNTFWRRRLRSGDVVQVDETRAPEPEPEPENG